MNDPDNNDILSLSEDSNNIIEENDLPPSYRNSIQRNPRQMSSSSSEEDPEEKSKLEEIRQKLDRTKEARLKRASSSSSFSPVKEVQKKATPKMKPKKHVKNHFSIGYRSSSSSSADEVRI